MRGGLRDRVHATLVRARRVERREAREFRRWLERTSVLVHLSLLLFVPLLIALVTTLANATPLLSFLLFPPLAAGTYTLFADPEGRYSSPVQFVAGLTVGALCGWAALVAAGAVGLANGTGDLSGGAVEAAIAHFAAIAATWVLDIEEPSAYSTALLALFVPEGSELAFTASVFLASGIVATVFFAWREQFYDRRAQFLYESTHGDDHVLVPMRGENPDSTAMLADLVDAFDGGFETRVSTLSIERYLAETADDFDLLILGASRDRSAASRLLSPPTFERIRDVHADVAIVDRN